ncbi:MAG: hypothetical protein ACTSQP_23115 [Promethearchaeota archaeon]
MRFHKDIEPEEKGKLENIVDLIKKCAEKNNYIYTEQLGNKRIINDMIGQEIYKVEFGLKKDNITYLIEITKLEI